MISVMGRWPISAGGGGAAPARMMAGVAHPYGVMPPVGSNDVVLVYPARPAAALSAVILGRIRDCRTPVVDALADLTAASVEHNFLAPREFMLARMAAAIAVDAPPASYLANAGAAAERGVTVGHIGAVMIAVGPVAGTARVVWQAGRSSGLWAWRLLWPTPRWPAMATPGGSSNRAHHPHGGAWAKTIGTTSER